MSERFLDNTQILDTGDGALLATIGVDIKDILCLYYRVTEASGDIDDLVIEMQSSVDNIVWDTITGTEETFAPAEDVKFQNNVVVASKFVRFQVITESTAASTATIVVQGK